MKHFLEPFERVEADRGYKGEAPEFVKTNDPFCANPEHDRMRGVVRARQEFVNERLKNYQCFNVHFRHSVEQNSACFRAVAVLVQLSIRNGEEIFSVEYNDH
jgi:hypothetical protein